MKFHPRVVLYFFLLVFVPKGAIGQASEIVDDSLLIESGSILFIDGELEYIPEDTIIYAPDKDKVKVKKDPYHRSETFYDSLEKKMGRTWFTKEIYNLLFKPSSRNNMADTVENVRSETFFEPYEGYRIRNVVIKKVDVLEGSVDDTLLVATSGFGELVNDIHINTRSWVLKKFLLFNKNDTVRPYQLSDNERIIRNLSFIEDARIRLVEVGDHEVDVHLITQDIFSIGLDGGLGSNEINASVFDKNFMGIGSTISFGAVYQYDNPHDKWGHGLGLEYKNILGSFIDSEFEYINTGDFDLIRFQLRKEFLTPQIKYAGEFDLGWRDDIRYDKEIDTTYEMPYQMRHKDIWIGRSFLLNGGLERTNLILALRAGQEDFLERPVVREDSNSFFHDRKYLISSISLKKINYLKSSKILGFGQIEDIPYGYIVKLLGGFSSEEFYKRPYFGSQITSGKYFDKIGYLGFTNRLGTFWSRGSLSELLLTFNLIYYTPLINVGQYQLRNILKSRNHFGVNNADKRGIDFSEDIRAFQNGGISGMGSYVLSFENIIYTPWYFYGFRFATFLFADVGILSEKGFELKNHETYSSFGFGLRIRNESLTISTVELRLAYLPALPYDGSHLKLGFNIERPTLFNEIFSDKPTFNTFNVD